MTDPATMRSGVPRPSHGCEHRYAALLRAAGAPPPPAPRRQRLSPLSVLGADARARHPAGARRRLHDRGPGPRLRPARRRRRAVPRGTSGLRPHASRSSTSGSPDCRRCARNSGESFVTGRNGSPPRPLDVGRACWMALRVTRPRPGSVPGAVGVVPGSEDVSLLYRARAGALAVNAPASARGSPSFGAGSSPRSDISNG